MNSTDKTYTVVSHDSGGAELLSSYVKQKKLNCHYVLAGPAVTIFRKKLGHVEISDLEMAVANSRVILCSTSWQSDIEIDAISYAHKLNKKSIAFLDHWVNYKDRFVRNGVLNLPNEIVVCDKAAMNIAKKTFPDISVKLIANPYIQDLIEDFKKFQHSNLSCNLKANGIMLYVGENISGHAILRHGNGMYFGYTEETALTYFIKNIKKLDLEIREIKVRPHPSEEKDKYSAQLSTLPYKISTSVNSTLIEDIFEADVVVGCSSMALAIASVLGKKVISSIPPSAKLPPWPYNNIVELRKVVGDH